MKRLFNLHRYPLYAVKIYWAFASRMLFSRKGIAIAGTVECLGLPMVFLQRIVASLLAIGCHCVLSVDKPPSEFLIQLF